MKYILAVECEPIFGTPDDNREHGARQLLAAADPNIPGLAVTSRDVSEVARDTNTATPTATIRYEVLSPGPHDALHQELVLWLDQILRGAGRGAVRGVVSALVDYTLAAAAGGGGAGALGGALLAPSGEGTGRNPEWWERLLWGLVGAAATGAASGAVGSALSRPKLVYVARKLDDGQWEFSRPS